MFFLRGQSCLDELSSGWKDTVEVNGYLEERVYMKQFEGLLSQAVHSFKQNHNRPATS